MFGVYPEKEVAHYNVGKPDIYLHNPLYVAFVLAYADRSQRSCCRNSPTVKEFDGEETSSEHMIELRDTVYAHSDSSNYCNAWRSRKFQQTSWSPCTAHKRRRSGLAETNDKQATARDPSQNAADFRRAIRTMQRSTVVPAASASAFASWVCRARGPSSSNGFWSSRRSPLSWQSNRRYSRARSARRVPGEMKTRRTPRLESLAWAQDCWLSSQIFPGLP